MLPLLAGLALTASANAQIWNEVGDAPQFPVPGQMTIGSGPLTTITGNLDIDTDVDMYCIVVTDPNAFGAQVVTDGGTLSDSQMFMFDSNGFGVDHNDDNVGFLSGIYSLGPAAGTVPPVALVAGAHYGLAVTSYNNDPVDAAGGLLWANSPFGDQTGPDGPAAANPIAGWTGSGNTGTYTITLVGATFCAVPAPGAAALMGIGGLLAIRRRR
jgi:MYXO-CTERM domain-containing protein